MRARYLLPFAAIIWLVISCASAPPEKRGAREVSVDQLLSAPSQYDGHQVLVKGFFLMPMTGDMALYQHEPDFHHHDRPADGIRVEVNNSNLMPLQLKECLLEGIFHASHDPASRGTLNEITRFELAQQNF